MDGEFTRPYIDTMTGETVMLTDRSKDADVDARYREIQPGQPISPVGEATASLGGYNPPGSDIVPAEIISTIRGTDRVTGKVLE